MRPALRLLLLFVPFACAAQQYPIVEITAAGSERYQSAEIIAYTGLKRDITKPLPLTTVENAAKKLAASGVFSDIAYRHTAVPGGMKVSFTVKDKPADQFLPPTFENIVWFTPDELNADISKHLPLYHNDLPLSGALADEVADVVTKLLAGKNVQAHVTSEMNCGVGQEKCHIQFLIDNLQITTRQIELRGAPGEIAAEVRTAAARSLIGQNYLRSVADPEFTRLVRLACLRRGLLKPVISFVTASVSSQDGDRVSVDLSADVTPGASYKFEGQTWTGNQNVPSARLERSVHLYQHLPVDGARLEADLTRVRTEYAMAGYMYATIKPEAQFDDAAGTVKYNFVVKEGPLFKMGNFDLAGFPDKLTEEVKSLWKLREGDPFDRTYITRFFEEPRIKQLFGGQKFVVEQGEGEQPLFVDVTVVLCHPEGCKPSPDVLYQSR